MAFMAPKTRPITVNVVDHFQWRVLLAPTEILRQRLSSWGHYVRFQGQLPCLWLATWDHNAKFRVGGRKTTYSSVVCKEFDCQKLGDTGEVAVNKQAWKVAAKNLCIEKECQHLWDIAQHRGGTSYSTIRQSAAARVLRKLDGKEDEKFRVS